MSGSGASPLMRSLSHSESKPQPLEVVDERAERVALVGDGAGAEPVADADLHPGDGTGSTHDGDRRSP